MLKDWKFRFRDLGPIRDASLQLGDLTIITGRNNTGKTYLVYTLYGFLRDFDELIGYIVEDWLSSGRFSRLLDLPSDDMAEQIIRSRSFDLSVSKSDLDSERDQLARELSGFYSSGGIDYVFNAQAGTFSSSRFEVEFAQVKNEYASRSLDDEVSGDLSVSFSNGSLSFSLGESRSPGRKGGSVTFFQLYLMERDLRKAYIQFLLQEDHAIDTKPHCGASARLAVSLSYPELESSRQYVVRELQQDPEAVEDEQGRLWIPADTLNRRTSRYALPINDEIDFVKGVPDTSPGSEPLDNEIPTRDIEEIMGGRFARENGELYFVSSEGSQGKFRIPLHLASSSALEMCRPYFHFAANRHSRNQLLIIDEPESHVDPVNQIKLARALVRWVNSGVKILISTHSDFIVKEINNLIMLDRAFDNKEELLRELNYREEDSINPSAIRAYYAEDGQLTPCSMNEFGIEVPSFEQSIDELIRVSETLGSRIIMQDGGDE